MTKLGRLDPDRRGALEEWIEGEILAWASVDTGGDAEIGEAIKLLNQIAGGRAHLEEYEKVIGIPWEEW